MELEGVQGTLSTYAVFKALASTIAACKTVLSSSQAAHHGLHDAEAALRSDVKTRSEAVDVAKRYVRQAVQDSGRLTSGVKPDEAALWLVKARAQILEASKSLTSISTQSHDNTVKAVTALKSASDASSALHAAAIKSKSNALVAQRNLQSAHGASSRMLLAAKEATEAAKDADKLAQLAKDITREVSGVKKILGEQQDHAIPPSLAKALIYAKSAEADTNYSQSVADAIDRPKTDWTALKLHVAQTSDALHNYDRAGSLATDNLGLRMITHTEKYIGEALQAAKDLEEHSRGTLDALDPTHAMRIEDELTQKAALLKKASLDDSGTSWALFEHVARRKTSDFL